MRRRVLLVAMLAALLIGFGDRIAIAAVCGDAILEAGEECDPGGGTFIGGNPNNASCSSGGMCFFRFSCCKFNCQFVGNGPACDDGNDCTGNGQCIQAEGNCTGASNLTVGTACGSPASNACTAPDTCNGSGVCLPHHSAAGTTCGDPTDNQCNAPDTCDGSGACLANFVPAGTPAGTLCDDGGGCTADTCNGSGGCAHTPVAEGQVCRGVAGACDVAEVCTSGSCPADAFVTGGTQCRASAGVCDVAESCTGSDAACPADGFASSAVVCRPTAGLCDVAESCTGSDTACPADGFASSTTECRAAAGVCDVAEACTGSGSDCPADAFAQASVECRAAAGPCDVAESCTGSDAACPGDAKSTAECRPSTGPCDPAEDCDGSANGCPADALEPNGAICDDGNPCTGTGTCDGALASCTTGTPIICGACEACDGVGGCVIGPLGVCRTITGKKAKLIVKNRIPATRNVLVWKFNKLLDDTEAADFGTPTDVDEPGYDFCVFQDLDPSPEVMDPDLIAHTVIPAGPPWEAAGTGFKYKKQTADPKGLLNMALKAADGIGKLNFKAKAAEVPAISLPLSGPVVVHFQSQSTCWQARYSTAKVNQADTYKGLAD